MQDMRMHRWVLGKEKDGDLSGSFQMDFLKMVLQRAREKNKCISPDQFLNFSPRFGYLNVFLDKELLSTNWFKHSKGRGRGGLDQGTQDLIVAARGK